MTEHPFITCLCPTYGRPRLLENAIACWLAQDYPLSRRELIIGDDAGQITEQSGDGWSVVSTATRFASLPEKYNALALLANPASEAFAIWEDDDVYLPHHLAAHVMAFNSSAVCHDSQWLSHGWSKPSRVLSTYTGHPEQEGAAGRFFASIAVSRHLWRTVGGLPVTKRADFDQQFLVKLTATAGPPADPLDFSPDHIPGYCFRWGSTGAYHGQGKMRSPEDETWYDRCEITTVSQPVAELHPRLDEETQRVFQLTGESHA